ncbi:MAG: MerR family transcriptional regulator [Promicromonosporaceae bacterium]|nr:MerR family transcriptional regulator [Promicromonosporaceae bacterium]
MTTEPRRGGAAAEEASRSLSTGELARKMGVSVRTLQYYDRTGVLHPTAISHGGRRLYGVADQLSLHRIQMLKALGFTLREIRDDIVDGITPQELLAALERQTEDIQSLLDDLERTRRVIVALADEMALAERVDLDRVADLIAYLLAEREQYVAISRMGDASLQRFRELALADSTHEEAEGASELNQVAEHLAATGVEPASEPGQQLAGRYWQLVQHFARGDVRIVEELAAFTETSADWGDLLSPQWVASERFVQEAVTHYFDQVRPAGFREALALGGEPDEQSPPPAASD